MGSYMVDTQNDVMTVTATAMLLLEASVQTVFIIATGKRVTKTSSFSVEKEKPAREVMTFLILINFALWAVDVCFSWSISQGYIILAFFIL